MGFFEKLIQGLRRTKEAFSKKLYQLFKGRELNDEFYEELENTLITSDLGVEASQQIIEEFKDECFKQKIRKPEDAKDLLKNIMVDAINYDIDEYSYPLVILVAGVNGVGKTTALGKLAKFFRNKGKSVVLAAADTFRAAASEQLEVWADRAKVRIIKHEEGSDPAAVVYDAIKSAKAKGTDVALVDTAGGMQHQKNTTCAPGKTTKPAASGDAGAENRTYSTLGRTTPPRPLAQRRSPRPT